MDCGICKGMVVFRADGNDNFDVFIPEDDDEFNFLEDDFLADGGCIADGNDNFDEFIPEDDDGLIF